MTEVLSVHDMELSPGQNMIVSLEPNELLRSPSSSSLISSLNTQNEHMDLSVLAVVIAAFRRTGLACQVPSDELSMDIGWPTNVRHIAHVTFDRFNGFLGLPAEFQTEIPRRVPSASASVFGVSPESMQCSFDRKGNSVPAILLLLQERLYDQGGLKAEGIFRINAENSQEEDLRNQLNRGIVPYNIDVHCLAGLIKAWFRELPKGILDSLSPEQVMQCHTEEQTLTLVKTLPPMQSALLDWGVDLMADVVQEEYYNKMNVHNIAMVFAPNMSQGWEDYGSTLQVATSRIVITNVYAQIQERIELSCGKELLNARYNLVLSWGISTRAWRTKIDVMKSLLLHGCRA